MLFSVRRDFLVLAVLFFGCQLGAVCQNKEAVELNQEYSNEYFSVKYSSLWIEQEDTDTTARIGCVYFLDKTSIGGGFTNNIIINVEKKKSEYSTTDIVQGIKGYMCTFVNGFKALDVKKMQVSGCEATLLKYSIKMNGRNAMGEQYTIKKEDNTIYSFTLTCDKKKYKKISKETNAMISSMVIK